MLCGWRGDIGGECGLPCGKSVGDIRRGIVGEGLELSGEGLGGSTIFGRQVCGGYCRQGFRWISGLPLDNGRLQGEQINVQQARIFCGDRSNEANTGINRDACRCEGIDYGHCSILSQDGCTDRCSGFGNVVDGKIVVREELETY